MLRRSCWMSFLACLAALPVHAEPPGKPSLAAAVMTLAPTLPAAQWQSARMPWTSAMVRQVAEVLDVKARAEQVLHGWSDGAALVWTSRRNPACQVSVGVMRFTSPAGARSYAGFALDLQRKQDEWLHKSSSGLSQVLESRVEAIQVKGAEEALRGNKQIRLAPQTPPISVTTFWLRAGDLVVECCWRDVPADAVWAEKVFATLRGAN